MKPIAVTPAVPPTRASTAADPMPRRSGYTTAFRCEFCGAGVSISRFTTVRHEAQCRLNPATRSCGTCRSRRQTGECDIDHLNMDRTNCGNWRAKP